MRSLLTGYAGAFNRRHRRGGPLVQNRYKSILVVEELYLLELVRYLHLNPLRGRLVPDLRALDRYPWTGHSALLGRVSRPRQDTATLRGPFGRTVARARAAYRGDARILGSSEFVARPPCLRPHASPQATRTLLRTRLAEGCDLPICRKDRSRRVTRSRFPAHAAVLDGMAVRGAPCPAGPPPGSGLLLRHGIALRPARRTISCTPTSADLKAEPQPAPPLLACSKFST